MNKRRAKYLRNANNAAQQSAANLGMEKPALAFTGDDG